MAMMRTRNDIAMSNKIKSHLDELPQELPQEQNPNRVDICKVDMCKKLFGLLATTKGQRFIKKHRNFNNVVQDKLKEFRQKIPELVIEWWRQIYGEEMPQPEPELEPEREPEPEMYHCGDDDFRNWVDEMSVSAPLTRTRLSFMEDVWDILEDTDTASHLFDAKNYNLELCEILQTHYGQNMLKIYPELTRMLVERLYQEYTDGDIQGWEEWWPNVFGCDIHDSRYDYSRYD
jgi:hypothetical protein